MVDREEIKDAMTVIALLHAARRHAADKGPSASLAPSAARSTYSKYASRAALGRRLASRPSRPRARVLG